MGFVVQSMWGQRLPPVVMKSWESQYPKCVRALLLFGLLGEHELLSQLTQRYYGKLGSILLAKGRFLSSIFLRDQVVLRRP